MCADSLSKNDAKFLDPLKDIFLKNETSYILKMHIKHIKSAF